MKGGQYGGQRGGQKNSQKGGKNVRCEMCGKDVPATVRALIEGTELTVCLACAQFGKALSQPLTKQEAARRLEVLVKPVKQEVEVLHLIVPDIAERVKRGRERLQLTQEEFAKKLAERASILSQIESGHFKPGIELARRIEKMIGTKLVEEITDEPVHSAKGSSSKPADRFVLGDFIKKR